MLKTVFDINLTVLILSILLFGGMHNYLALCFQVENHDLARGNSEKIPKNFCPSTYTRAVQFYNCLGMRIK